MSHTIRRPLIHWRCICGRPVLLTPRLIWAPVLVALALYWPGGFSWSFWNVFMLVGSLCTLHFAYESVKLVVNSARHRTCAHKRGEKVIEEMERIVGAAADPTADNIDTWPESLKEAHADGKSWYRRNISWKYIGGSVTASVAIVLLPVPIGLQMFVLFLAMVAGGTAWVVGRYWAGDLAARAKARTILETLPVSVARQRNFRSVFYRRLWHEAGDLDRLMWALEQLPEYDGTVGGFFALVRPL